MERQNPIEKQPRHLLTISALNNDDLRTKVENLQKVIKDDASFINACLKAKAPTPTENHRLAFTASSFAEAAPKLQAYLNGQNDSTIHQGVANKPLPKVAFIFTGQGSQYVGMGQELYNTQPLFRETLHVCSDALAGVMQVPLIDVILGKNEDTSLIDQTLYTQPALFAIEYALAEVFAAWGINPDLVLGHSIGEYVAAARAGVFSFADGIKLIAARARLMQSLPPYGKMAAIAVSADKIVDKLEPYRHEISLAAINGDEAIVISGGGERVSAVAEHMKQNGAKVIMLTVSHAFHSPLVEPILDEFEAVAASITYATPTIELVSNVTGELASSDVCTAHYWRCHVRQAVRFAQGIRTAYKQGCRIFVELGPNPVLLGMARPLLTPDAIMLPTLRRRRSDWQQILDSIAELFVCGIDYYNAHFAT
ncbi:MAG: acyltransferase domain-containing protein [Deltaproteobacteria bacterium]|nr:acyltransferase domain-containing protein [Deltaproteobacteria bacterium]